MIKQGKSTRNLNYEDAGLGCFLGSLKCVEVHMIIKAGCDRYNIGSIKGCWSKIWCAWALWQSSFNGIEAPSSLWMMKSILRNKWQTKQSKMSKTRLVFNLAAALLRCSETIQWCHCKLGQILTTNMDRQRKVIIWKWILASNCPHSQDNLQSFCIDKDRWRLWWLETDLTKDIEVSCCLQLHLTTHVFQEVEPRIFLPASPPSSQSDLNSFHSCEFVGEFDELILKNDNWRFPVVVQNDDIRSLFLSDSFCKY